MGSYAEDTKKIDFYSKNSTKCRCGHTNFLGSRERTGEWLCCLFFFFCKSGEPQETLSMEKIHASVLLASVKIMAALFPGLGWKD